jgi:hypothetical protein
MSTSPITLSTAPPGTYTIELLDSTVSRPRPTTTEPAYWLAFEWDEPLPWDRRFNAEPAQHVPGADWLPQDWD